VFLANVALGKTLCGLSQRSKLLGGERRRQIFGHSLNMGLRTVKARRIPQSLDQKSAAAADAARPRQLLGEAD
jgi:hypothetical protein